MSENNTIAGTYVDAYNSGTIRMDYLLNSLIAPTLIEYMQITINYETGTKMSQNKYRFTYQNWNTGFVPEVFLNGGAYPLSPDLYTVDYQMGIITLNLEDSSSSSAGVVIDTGDNIQATYNFNYFPLYVLEGFINRAVAVMNTAGVGAINQYTFTTMPTYWDGISADLIVAMCMEKLILEYDMWKGRLVFAISPSGLYESNDNIIAQLEMIKTTATERAYKTLENPRFRVSYALARPTQAYYEALLAGSGSRAKNGNISYGKLRGAKFNKLVGSGPLGGS